MMVKKKHVVAHFKLACWDRKIRRKRANVICKGTMISSRGINGRRMWWGEEALYVG
jgi:hypothetical protein